MEKVTGTSTWRGWSLVAVVTCEQINITLAVANTPTPSLLLVGLHVVRIIYFNYDTNCGGRI